MGQQIVTTTKPEPNQWSFEIISRALSKFKHTQYFINNYSP
jgi:hypothetical protein